MPHTTRHLLILAAASAMGNGVAQAALLDRGGGLLYDDILNITWLQDANYARTSGHDGDGRMTWDSAMTWASNLVFHDSVRGVDWTGWRLPTVLPKNGIRPNYDLSYDGSSDSGYNISRPTAELAYMYYVNLGLHGFFTPVGNPDPTWGIFGDGTAGGEVNIGLVRNLQSSMYWYGTEYQDNPYYVSWVLSTGQGVSAAGVQGGLPKYWEVSAWAVRPGDVGPAPVPEPETYAMLLAGLGVLGTLYGRRPIRSM